MRKINKIILSILTLVLLVIFSLFKFNSSHTYKISITNNTNEIVKNLKIIYKTGGDIIQNISQIQPKDSFKYKIWILNKIKCFVHNING